MCHTVEGHSHPAAPALGPETLAASSSDKLHSRSPVTADCGFPQGELNRRDPQHSSCPQIQEFWQENTSPGPQLQVHSQTSASTDSSPFLPELQPPDNPLFSIDLQAIEPAGQAPDSSFGLVRIPGGQIQKLTLEGHEVPPSLTTVHTAVPPKLIPGVCEEDFLRRRREYWRIKKKEQRAKKAIREKVCSQKSASTTSWRPVPPSQDTPAQVEAFQVQCET